MRGSDLLDYVGDPHDGLFLRLDGDPPELLFHYTTAAGLKGILESGTIWATDAEFLNDALELRFGRDTLREQLLDLSERLAESSAVGSPEEARAETLASAAGQLEPGSSIHDSQRSHSVYVACLCEDGDLLSQWRGYGAGGGYAIGFDAGRLREFLDARNDSQLQEMLSGQLVGECAYAHLGRVRYGGDAEFMQTVLEAVAPERRGHPGSEGVFQANRLLYPALARLKNHAFHEEREWRVMIASEGGLQVSFRPTALGLTPYTAVPFPTDAVRRIVIGPGLHSDVRARGVSRLLGAVEYDAVDVRESSAPFRG